MRKTEDDEQYEKTMMRREHIIEILKEKGCRITKQRLVLLDIILQEECSCCKEIFYEASKKDKKIGKSTVYRMVGLLEEIGAINRKNMYKIYGNVDEKTGKVCRIIFDDRSKRTFTQEEWRKILLEGLRACGYIEKQDIVSVDLISE